MTLEPTRVKKLLKGERVQNIPVVLPQTQEHGTAELILASDHSGKIEIKNITRIEKE